MWENIVYLLIGALITFIITLINKIIEYNLNNFGKYEIYIKDISDDVITINLQIKNTTKSIKFIRDLKICKFDNDNNKVELTQYYYSKELQNGQIISETYYGEKGSYSFTICEKSFKVITCMFKADCFDFNKFNYTLQFYNELDRLLFYTIPKLVKYKWYKLSAK